MGSMIPEGWSQSWQNILSCCHEWSTTFPLEKGCAKAPAVDFLTPLSPSVFYQACSRKLYNWLKVASYRPDQQVEEDDDFMDENQGKGIRVLGIAFSSAR